MNVNYSQKARNLLNRIKNIQKDINGTFEQFHKETVNKYRTKKNLTIMNMDTLKTQINPMDMSNENFNKYLASLSPEERQSNTILILKALRRNRFKTTRSGDSMVRQSEKNKLIAEAGEKNKIKLAGPPPPIPKSVIATIMKNSFKPENFENFNASVNLRGEAKTKYYKQLRNLKKKALNVFDNKQKRVNLVKGKKLSRANATNIVQGSKLNLK